MSLDKRRLVDLIARLRYNSSKLTIVIPEFFKLVRFDGIEYLGCDIFGGNRGMPGILADHRFFVVGEQLVDSSMVPLAPHLLD